MKYIRSLKKLLPKNPNGKTIVYMHGYGCYTWQAARQLKVLTGAGYQVFAIDFKKILNIHNPQALIDLMDEVDDFFQNNDLIHTETIIIGISLGGLAGYNMLRRHKKLKRLLAITGGNIALLPSKRALKKKWKITREELTERWRAVNMYTPVGKPKGKRMIMLLPKRDKIIDPKQVTAEFELQRPYNELSLIRTPGGHYRTGFTETVLRPKKIFKYIHELERL